MAKGLRFFGTDYNSIQFGGTVSSSSASNTKEFAFDGLTGTRWISDGENTDGNDILLEMDYGFNRTIDCLYIYNTNIENIIAYYWNGSSYTTINGSNATITKNSTLDFVFIKLNSPVTTSKVKLTGTDTIIPNQEKFVTLFFAFQEIGQFRLFPDFEPKFNPKQDVFELTDGRGFVIERGEAFSAEINLKSIVNQFDIDLSETLISRREPFFIWPNGGDESIFRFKFRPFRFQDIFKVTVVGDNSPQFSKNYYRAGYNNNINLIEVV